MGNLTGNADKESTKTGQNDKIKRRWNMLEQKGKGNTGKNNSTTCGNKPESTGERKKIKEILTKGKTIDKTGNPKTTKENSTNNWEEMTRKHTNKQMQKKPNDFGKNNGNQKHNGKAKWINNMNKELEGPEEGPKAEIQIDLLKSTLKKYQTGKRQATIEYIVFGSRNTHLFLTD